MKHWVGTIVIIIISFLLNPQTTFAVQSYQVGNILFSDDFNDGNYGGWTVLSGTWGIDSLKRLYGIASGTLKSGNIAPTGSWANYRVEVDVQNDGGIDEGINFRYVNEANTYALNLRHRYNAPNTGTPEVKLLKAVGGVTTTIASTHNVTLEHFITYKVKIEVVGEHIQVWIDNNLIFDLDDPGTTLKTGGIAVTYWTGDIGTINIRADNVKVTQLSPIPKTPVIFIPGIGGTELKTGSSIDWSADNGHSGNYSHLYPANESVWLNESEAAKLGNDDYFDVLRMQPNGIDSAANIITGNILSRGYPAIDSYFAGLGYTKDVDYFPFPYDWRKDVRSNISNLNTVINTATQTSGKTKVNILAHSLGGLVARSYINEGTNSARINKLIELGVPHVGSTKALHTLIYGDGLTQPFMNIIPIGIPASEIKDISNNLPSMFQLLPAKKYYDFYPPELSWAFYPFSDESDIDLNGETGLLSYAQLKTLLSNIGTNMPVYQFGENLHDSLDNAYATPTGIPTYLCVGNGFATLGQIRETYYITWPTNMFPKTDQLFINGDDTVPNSSAALKNNYLDLSGNATIYYTNQRHGELANPSGACMNQATNWLKDTPETTPDSTSTMLEGTQINIDNEAIIELTDALGRTTKIENDEVQINIPGTLIDKIGQTTIAFINKSAGQITAVLSPQNPDPVNINIRTYQNDTVTKSSIYQNTDITSPTIIDINPSQPDPKLIVSSLMIQPTGSATGSAAFDTTPPITTATIDKTTSKSSKKKSK
jgi:pimeloyl-ACP methyl ester carboxylesterase